MQEEGHIVLFIMETKIRAKHVKSLKTLLGFSGVFAVDSDGLSGGTGLFGLLMCRILGNLIMMCWSDNSCTWCFIGFYGETRAENRHQS